MTGLPTVGGSLAGLSFLMARCVNEDHTAKLYAGQMGIVAVSPGAWSVQAFGAELLFAVQAFFIGLPRAIERGSGIGRADDRRLRPPSTASSGVGVTVTTTS
jgi:hypothetical protein